MPATRRPLMSDLDAAVEAAANAITTANCMPVFQDNNGSYVLLYRS